MPDLLLELFSEEIPARMQRQAAEDLKRLVTNALVERNLVYEGAQSFVTPRRLTLHVVGLPAAQPDLREERKGPRVGAPDAAVQGFLKSAGLKRIEDAKIETDPKKGQFYVAVIEKPGRAAIDVIEAAPDRMREVDGIGPVRARRITAAWAEQKIVREIMVFLHSHGVGTARAVRIYKTYGADAVQVMSENPYRLARDIRGIGFKTADAIADRLGIEKTAMIRVRAGISYALTEAMDDGHCGLPTEELARLAVALLEVPQELVLPALDLELAEGTVIADTVGDVACVFLGGLYRAEQGIAERLRCLVNGALPWPSIDPEKALPWIERKTGLALAASQVGAIRLALASKVLVITGGKTETTDDAYIQAAKAPISASIAGRVIEVDVAENQSVKAGQVL